MRKPALTTTLFRLPLMLLCLCSRISPLHAQTMSAVTIPATLTGTYTYRVTTATAGSPVKVGQSLTMVVAPGGGACLAGFLLMNPYSTSFTTGDAFWDAYSLGYRIRLQGYSASLGNMMLSTMNGQTLATLSGSRTGTSTTGCSAGADFAQLSQLLTKAEEQYPTLFPRSPASEALRIVQDTVSRGYPGTGITLSIKNGEVSVTGGPWGKETKVLGKVSDLLTLLLNPQLVPRTFPDLPISWTLAGNVVPVLIKRPSDATQRANDLAGVTRDPVNNWKEYKIGRTRDQVLADLRPKLKRNIDQLFSGGSAAFPESYSIDQGTVSALIDSMKAFQWELLLRPPGLKDVAINEISNVSYEYLYLKKLLAVPDSSRTMFFPMDRDAVSLAVPLGGHNTFATLKPMGARIKSWVLNYLATNTGTSSGSGSTGSGSTDQNTIIAITNLFVSLASAMFDPPSVLIADVTNLRTQVYAQVNLLPSKYDRFKTASKAYADWYLNNQGKCIVDRAASTAILDPPSCNTALSLQGTVSLEYILSGAEAAVLASGSTSGTGSTGTTTTTGKAGDYYQVFLTELTKAVNSIYENEFDTIFTEKNEADTRSYTPIVITAIATDTIRSTTGTNDNCCGFRESELAYYAKPRTGVMYRARGEDVKFQGAEGKRFEIGKVSRVERIDLTASSLNDRRGSALTSQMEVVVSWPFSAMVAVGGCVTGDEPCLQRLAKVRIPTALLEVSTEGYTIFDWSFYFSTLRSSAIRSAGIDLVAPTNLATSSFYDRR